MAYVTAVTDRTITDVTAPVTAKGYFNVADWTRIYGNAQVTNSLAEIELGTPVVFNTVTAPTTSTIASVTDFNTLLANIERLRLAVVAVPIAGTTTEIKDDYVAGINEETFDYTDVNLWESTIDAIWAHYGGPDLQSCPTLTENLTVLTGTTLIVVGCINADTYAIDIQGTGALYII